MHDTVPPMTSREAGCLSGQRIGGFRLGYLLGRGAHAEVYAARHVEHSTEQAAFKVPHLWLSDALELRQRFLFEAKIAQRLSHPHIVRVDEVGLAPGGRVYLRMELLSGCPLSARLRLGPLSPAQVRALGLQIADALQAIHDCGAMHGDIKPENIMLIQESPLTAKLLDFGLAKAFGAPLPGPAGQRTGTPAYMAPEQWLGLADVDGRADIYQLGAVLYEALTGTRPFLGESEYELETAHLNQPPPPHPQLGAAPGLERLIALMLGKIREERPQQAAEVVAVLRALSQPRPRARPWSARMLWLGSLLLLAPAARDRAAPPKGPPVGAVALGRYEVSRGEFRQVCLAEPEGLSRPCAELPASTQYDRLPMTQVLTSEAEAYCRIRYPGGRLPTDEEWEHAARSGPPGQGCVNALGSRVDRELEPVDSMGCGQTPEGLFHLFGNAAELAASGHVHGGSTAVPLQDLRRPGKRLSERSAYVGFRCALPLQEVLP